MARIPASERDAFYEKRRAELADAALELWAERGFDQTSVAAIAEAAGVSKGTFYLSFESKDALLEEVFRRNSLAPNLAQLVDDLKHRPLEDAVRGFVRGAWRHLCDHRGDFKAFGMPETRPIDLPAESQPSAFCRFFHVLVLAS